MKNAMATEKTESSFFDQTEIPVTVKYDFLPGEPMRFFLRLQMAKEEREARQKLFALPADEREAKQHEYNVSALASLSTRAPENVPTFDPGSDHQQAIKDFFSGTNPMKQKVVEDVLALYFTKTQPVEFFR